SAAAAPSLLLVVLLILLRVLFGVFDRLRVDQVHGLGVGFVSLGVLLALLGLLDGADHEIGKIVESVADLGRRNAFLAGIGETLIGERFGAGFDVAVGVFRVDVIGDPFIDKSERAFAHSQLLFFTSSS